MTASSTTKNKNDLTHLTDSRAPIFGREVTSVFKRYFSLPHSKASNVKSLVFPVLLTGVILKNLPYLLSMRWYLKKRRKNRSSNEMRVLYFSDNLDEVNGIANNLRHVVSYMKSNGYQANLAGCAFNTRTNGVIENHYVVLTPRLYSMDQLGYANSELALPNFKPVFRLFKRYPADLIELETPSPGSWAVAIGAKIMGIKVISHYRTDVPTYTCTLVKAKWMHVLVLFLMRIFYNMTRPVISPCQEYSRILKKDIWVPSKAIQILPRGIPLNQFSPLMRGLGVWEKFGGGRPVRFLFVGRISKEKDLPFLEKLWHLLHQETDSAELMFVGNGWYLDTLKSSFSDCPEVLFAGEQGGETLASLYADADFFIFPSGTDTFGNVVVEALASGTPAIVTDKGGPQDVIKDQGCGFILPFGKETIWLEKLKECIDIKLKQPEKYESMRRCAFERSRFFSLENTAKSQWAFFKTLYDKSYKK